MRKIQKKQILEVMKSLGQAHEELQRRLQQGDRQTAQALLADCQDCMLQVGNVIEQVEGESCPAIWSIAAYCEGVFHFYQALGSGQPEPGVPEGAIQKALERVRAAVEEIPGRIEAVFFPYKASMWDSLESIYLAAKADENCDAYCVPIPYYDLNPGPDHSPGRMVYEGGNYPKGIEITDWEAYRFEERRPDIIFIHNPYDDWNSITAVHPRFYAQNLKKYTDRLVYVPYFVLDEIDPKDQGRIEGMKRFCFLPGTIYSDRVIVQSEAMRQIYINEYQKEARRQGLADKYTDRGMLEKKFLALGSPKYDKVLTAGQEIQEIPEEWRRIIEKPDGSRKKIIFYNTSVSAFLEHNEKMLAKIENVLRIFQEQQDEAALLWRPHPLMESTIKSLRPWLWEAYERIIAAYKAGGWGIYDDTADFNRAIALCDAYYGDGSSVVQLCQKAGKPVMLQNVEILEG